MDFKPSYLATGIGSFPHQDEKELFRLILENFSEIPFWPQMPKRSFLEGMVVQYSEGFPSLKWDEKSQKVWIDTANEFEKEVETFYQNIETGNPAPFKMTEDFARGLRVLNEFSSAEYRKNIKYIKGQITGPVTFGLSVAGPDGKPVFYDPTFRDILIKHLSMKARWMEQRFNKLFPGIPTMIFFDEPSLSSLGSAFSGLNREEVIDSLNACYASVKGLKGTHCCGNMDWSVLLSTHLDILNFDAYEYLETLSLYPKELKGFLERGGILAWGLVPTSEAVLKEDALSLVKRFKEGIKTLSQKGIDSALLQRAIITPACGTGSLSVELSERICALTAEVSKRLRENISH